MHAAAFALAHASAATKHLRQGGIHIDAFGDTRAVSTISTGQIIVSIKRETRAYGSRLLPNAWVQRSTDFFFCVELNARFFECANQVHAFIHRQ